MNFWIQNKNLFCIKSFPDLCSRHFEGAQQHTVSVLNSFQSFVFCAVPVPGMLGWSQWIVSLAHWAQPGSRLVRASVHQKIHEQDAVFGKVLHSELMIPSIRHDHHFYDNRICDNVFLVWIYLKVFCWF